MSEIYVLVTTKHIKSPVMLPWHGFHVESCVVEQHGLRPLQLGLVVGKGAPTLYRPLPGSLGRHPGGVLPHQNHRVTEER